MPTPRRRARNVVAAALMFVLVSVLAGVLVAGLFVPVAGLAGVGSKAAASELDKLPVELSAMAPPTRSEVRMADGETLAYFYDENRTPVPLDQIAPVMRQAQLAIEDQRFYEHGALDIRGTVRAFVSNTTTDNSTQGGSSITQQYVKMLLVEQCAGDKACVQDAKADSVARKIRELRYAIAIEKRMSKDQILNGYLNIAYYGDGAYGVEEAARHYFGTTAAELTLPQAALLAGLVQNPDANNPVKNPSTALDRRDVVLNRMAELQIVSTAEAVEAKTETFDSGVVTNVRNGCIGTQYPFLCDYVRRTLLLSDSLGATEKERTAKLNRGGLTIQTAIDPRTQDIAQQNVSDVVGPTDPLISTMSMIQPGTGLIVAMAQSRPVMGNDASKGETYWNLAVDPALGGLQGYQAGSTFKAFTAAAALEQGTTLSERIDARKTINYKGRTYRTCDGKNRVGETWKVSNSTGRNGNMNMYRAAAFSVNNYFVELELDTGMCPVTQMAEKLGVKLGTKDRDLVDFYQNVPSFTLGSVEVSPLSMAEAYATFAARGIHCDPIIVKTISGPDGATLPAPSANCKRVLSEDVADGVNKLLANVMTNGTGRRAMTRDRRPQAGKTGTISGNEAVWFAGYTPEIAGVAMISIDNQKKPFRKSSGDFRRSGVKKYRVPSTGVRLDGSGSADAGRKIWQPAMNTYLADVPETDFVQPPFSITGNAQQ